jgi:hypothetical protein
MQRGGVAGVSMRPAPKNWIVCDIDNHGKPDIIFVMPRCASCCCCVCVCVVCMWPFVSSEVWFAWTESSGCALGQSDALPWLYAQIDGPTARLRFYIFSGALFKRCDPRICVPAHITGCHTTPEWCIAFCGRIPISRPSSTASPNTPHWSSLAAASSTTHSTLKRADCFTGLTWPRCRTHPTISFHPWKNFLTFSSR